MNEKANRKYYLDNLRCAVVLLVVVYHVIYSFNSIGIIRNLTAPGLPAMDAVIYLVYPWFMVLLFVCAGISAGYAIERDGGKGFLKRRANKLLVPSVAGIFMLGWVSGWVTSLQTDMFGGQGDLIPWFIKMLIYCIAGIGPLWFAHELFLATAVLCLIRKIDKSNRLSELGESFGKLGIVPLLLCAVPLWLCSNILNTPVIEVYRNGIYIFAFLIGHYVFIHESVTDCLVKYRFPLLIASCVLGISYTAFYFGENITSMEYLKNPFTNIFAWVTVLALLGCFKKYFDRDGKFRQYMNKRSYGFYLLHYPVMILIAYFITAYLGLPIALNYILTLLGTAIALPLFYEAVSRIPCIRFLLLGIKKPKKQTE